MIEKYSEKKVSSFKSFLKFEFCFYSFKIVLYYLLYIKFINTIQYEKVNHE